MAAVGALTGCAANSAPSTSTIEPVVVPDADSVEWAYEADVAVIGGGAGGLSAAAAAAEEGKSSLVLEISSYLGGGSVYSGGTIHDWGCETWEEFRDRTDNLGDAALSQTYVETFRNIYIPWLQDNGIPLTPYGGERGYTKDWNFGSGEEGYLRHKAFFDALSGLITGNGGTILTQTRGVRLVVDGENTVCGVLAQKTDGSD
ncbi:MAG: FAD-binding protein, partial [Clostridia bacterium]|nr:FAD-binding protein [Clostridia bacterium]